MIENKQKIPSQPKAWVVSVNMGYGHQRTAYPLRHLAPNGKVINANDYEDIPKNDRQIWETSRRFYEFISNFKRIPLIGEVTFQFFNRFQKIWSFYPRRDLSKPTFQLVQIYSLIKKGWGKHLIDKLKVNPLPLVTTFFTPAFMAEVWNYPGEIYCVVCDADIARAWAPLNPRQSRIKYFAPNDRVVERLKLYGVREENIFLTGYPLPKECLGSEKLEILRKDLARRLVNLDPTGLYRTRYEPLIKEYIDGLSKETPRPLTILFSIGGAGAQKELAIKIIKGLIKKIEKNEIKIIISVGIKEKVKEYFIRYIKYHKLGDYLNKNIEILWQPDMNNYFEKFNQTLRVTDILWTKPSELSFYTALGLPIIIAPTIGSQEDYNREWLLRHHAGILQENLSYVQEWLADLLERGWLASAAMHGFLEAEKFGVYNIERIISKST